MIFIYLIYRIFFASSFLRNQPSQMFWLPCAILEPNDCIIPVFPITLWPWVKVKIIQTGISH